MRKAFSFKKWENSINFLFEGKPSATKPLPTVPRT